MSRASRGQRVPTPPSSTPTAPSSTPPAATVTVVAVAGMTCRACEHRIEREVRRLPGVEQVSASAARGQVRVTSRAPIPPRAIAAAVEAAGYEIGRTPWVSHDTAVWLSAAVGVVVVAVLAVVAQLTGIAELAGRAGDLSQGGLIVALLLGLAAGVSTCLALTGGLVLALSAAFAARQDPATELGVVARLRPSAVFVTGRIVGFGVLGALLGAVGATLSLPSAVVAALMVAVAILMTILGARLTGLSPRIAAWSPTIPTGLGRRIGLDEGAVTGYSDTRAAALGVATFLLPCGFTQAVQVYALSTGSPLTAGAIMAVFAIGTAPGLLALGGLPGLVPAGARPMVLRSIGVVVLGFALLNGVAGLRLLGVAPSIPTADANAPAPVVTMEDGVQVLRTFQVASGYQPTEASLYAGVPTRWVVESIGGRSCAIFLQVPSLGVAVTLKPGENTIDLPPLKPGHISYMCSMGMYTAELTVVPQPQSGLEGIPSE